MGGRYGSQDFFETEGINRFDRWSIPFQTPHDDTQNSRNFNVQVSDIGRIRIAHYFWFSDRNLESCGVEGMMKKPMRPMRTENNPSYIYIDRRGYKRLEKEEKKNTRMKIQAHPGLPPMPFIFSIAAASNPERATESWNEL